MRTAKWVGVLDGDVPEYTCSNCGGKYYIPWLDDLNYCPNCGAYMKTINKVKPIRKRCKTCKYSEIKKVFYNDGTFDGSYMKKLVCLGEKEPSEVDKSHKCKYWRAK